MATRSCGLPLVGSRRCVQAVQAVVGVRTLVGLAAVLADQLFQPAPVLEGELFWDQVRRVFRRKVRPDIPALAINLAQAGGLLEQFTELPVGIDAGAANDVLEFLAILLREPRRLADVAFT